VEAPLFWLLTGAFAAPPQVDNIGWSFINVWVVHTDDGAIVVDSHNEKQAKRIVRRLRRVIDPAMVKAVVVTHGHPDHAGSAHALGELLGVPVVAGAPDQKRIERGQEADELPATSGGARVVSKLIKHHFPGYTPDVLVQDSLDLTPYGVPGTARVQGGHTKGSLVVELDGGAVLVGDLIRSGFIRKHTPRLHFFHEDVRASHATLETVLADNHTLYPGHGGSLPADRVERWLAERAPHHEERLRERLAKQARERQE
jgi:glyoxylase-like metal-dependent hydrolase (beta-lactamase superfamily II)